MYGEREWVVGDTVYRGGTFGHKIETIVRTTHNGERFVTDGGTRILKHGKYAVGSHFREMWHLYTPEVGEQWGSEIACRDALRRLSKLDISTHRPPWREMATPVLFEIADCIEQRLPRKDGQDDNV